MIRAIAIAIVVGGALSTPVSAQIERDVVPGEWDLVEQDGATAAVIAFDNDLAVIARCRAGNFDLVLHGLPQDRGEDGLRSLRVAIDEPGERFDTWHTSEDGLAAFSRLPAMLARQLRTGGELNITVPAQGSGRARRYVVTLPPSPQAVDRALLACGKPSVDPRDALVGEHSEGVSPFTWERQPSLQYPELALRAGVGRGSVTLSCVAMPDGRVEECRIESEYPQDVGFGREALRAARGARVAISPNSPPRMFAFPVSFSVR